ncbi:unnamed protein product [Cylindrotheca closterium]|uniref:Uncharacterized protein n=1 Tax=Cylindrotheca closterium TaxID=2856 RepID=A0AAD2FQQ6_9STRA|nr:unnamed protein product [Cylindrotheca closterium]
MRPKEARQYIESFLQQWRPVFGCGDVDDAESSTSDLVLRKNSGNNPRRKTTKKNTQKWLRQVSNKLMEQTKIERNNTDSTSDSHSAEPSIPSTIETSTKIQSLSQANLINDSQINEPIPAAVETTSIGSLTNTDVTGDSQFEETMIRSPVKPTQRACSFENNGLPRSQIQSDEPALATIENTRRVQSLPNASTHNNRPLRRQKRNPEREAFFKVRVYDLGYSGDDDILALSTIGGDTQQADDNKGWPNDFYKPKN